MFKTKQEKFWAGDFGDEYIDRNKGVELLASNLNFFSKSLKNTGKISSCIEFGANIGMNLEALKLLYPRIYFEGVEINKSAAKLLADLIGDENVFQGSIFDYKINKKFELSLVKGVLVHNDPEKLDLIYEKLYQASSKFILICEYYNPSPMSVLYRGHKDKLFKRDFAGEIMEKYPDLQLIDYGFSYKRDVAFPQDDITWFLFKK